MSNSLWPHRLPHTRLLCPALSPGVCSESCPLSQRCHPTISSSLAPFSCLQFFPASRSFPMSQFFASGGQNIASALASVLPMNIQGWFPLGLIGLISLLSKGFSRVFSSNNLKTSFLWHSAYFMVQVSHPCLTTGKTIALTLQTFVCKVIFLLFKKLFMTLLFNLLLAAGSWLPCRLFCTCGTWWLLSWSTGSRRVASAAAALGSGAQDQ